jgi:hypothetical protein
VRRTKTLRGTDAGDVKDCVSRRDICIASSLRPFIMQVIKPIGLTESHAIQSTSAWKRPAVAAVLIFSTGPCLGSGVLGAA